MKKTSKIFGLLLALSLTTVPFAQADCKGKECASKKGKHECKDCDSKKGKRECKECDSKKKTDDKSDAKLDDKSEEKSE